MAPPATAARTTAPGPRSGAARRGRPGAASARLVPPTATLRHELGLAQAGHRLVGGCDEVGRGALAGPVTVGLVVVDPAAAGPLEGVRDSKLLAPAERERLAPLIRAWALAWGVGHAEADEIDRFGLVAALRLAGLRAHAALAPESRPHAVLLDGNLDWLAPPAQEPLDAPAWPAAPEAAVHLRVKADLECLSVAAASVLAKVERDGLMAGHHERFPRFGWDANKGYGTAVHRAALREHGPTPLHRRSWRLDAGAAAE